MKNIKSKLLAAALVVLVCAVMVNAERETMTIVMSEGVTGSDGHSRLDGSVSSTIDVMRLGFPNSLNNYVSQVYFKIPEALKAPGVIIGNATLKIELGGGAYGTTGYTQLYYQLMHLNYDTNTVCVANALATNNAANYTKIGGFNGVTTWDVTSALTADIAAGNTCLPVVVRITDSSGNFIADNTVGVQGYNGSLWASERLRSTPKLTITYFTPGNQPMMFYGLPDSVYPANTYYTDFVDVWKHSGTNDQCIRFYYAANSSGQVPDGDGRSDILVDQLSVKNIQEVIFTNWYIETTYDNPRLMSIWVAPASGAGSESDQNFNKLSKASYSVKIFPQTGDGDASPMPDVSTMGTKRTADVIDVDRRYYMISLRSTFFGDLGVSPSYRWTSSFGDIAVKGTDTIGSCSDVADLGLILPADLNKDCYVNMLDMKLQADEWLLCTDPGVAGCIQIPVETQVHEIAQVPSGGITVDGSLSEWPVSSEWIYLTKLYDGVYPYDVKEAKFSLRWDGSTDKIYAAVVVDDLNHNFTATPDFTADLIEIYSQGSTAGGTEWGVTGYGMFDAAQQYIVGHNTTIGSWSAWADKSVIDSNAGFESAVTLNGDKIIYEVGVKQFINYGSISGDTTEVTNLAEGTNVGFDIIADTVHGSSLYSMISENMLVNKYLDASRFQVYTLVNSLSERYCGDWGYETSDITQDCRVNLNDFAIVALQWFNCNAPIDSNCPHNW